MQGFKYLMSKHIDIDVLSNNYFIVILYLLH